jgi:hypothetical protein
LLPYNYTGNYANNQAVIPGGAAAIDFYTGKSEGKRGRSTAFFVRNWPNRRIFQSNCKNARKA